MKNSDYCLLKMQQHPLLLRRPLPPKIPKVSLYKKKIQTEKTTIPKSGEIVKPKKSQLKSTSWKQKMPEPITATSGKTEALHVNFSEEEITSTEKGETSFLDVTPGRKSGVPIRIQNILLDHQVQETMTVISTSYKSAVNIYWHIPHIALGSFFFPRSHSASSRVFLKEFKKLKRKLRKQKKIRIGENLEDILNFSSKFSKPLADSCLIIAAQLNKEHPKYHWPLPKTTHYTHDLPPSQRGRSSTLLSHRPSSISTKVESQKSGHFQQETNVVNKMALGIAQFPGILDLPTQTLPRKPRRQSQIESLAESRKAETVRRRSEGFSKYRKPEPEGHILRGEGFRTVAATRYETIMAMVNLATASCQVHGRNALSLKVYCLKKLQVLMLRNNPIKEIPSSIKKLKTLRIFSIAFNLIHDLPHGSLDKLTIDGNYMTSLPPAILRLNLTKIHLENTYTHHTLWAENSLNSPLQLTHIIALFIIKNNLCRFYDVISAKIQKLLKSTSNCDWCHGAMFGEGLRIIRSCDIFGASQLPIMFHVCSPPCYMKMKESTFIFEGLPPRRISLNMDWTKDRKYSDISYLKSH
ncbi:leucine-rich repeat-containing protein 63 isoform X2 [Castor canadensis]|uniref:Leucine-rich repeat-containing protein 63 isoform X2 n=1 Tax=Castor canadensis TaxID=51338 RepID=A0AC58K3M8_CASCN